MKLCPHIGEVPDTHAIGSMTHGTVLVIERRGIVRRRVIVVSRHPGKAVHTVIHRWAVEERGVQEK
jgi:hypothetical protein